MSLEYRNNESEAETEDPPAPRDIRVPIPYYTCFLLACIAGVTAAQVRFGFEPTVIVAGFDKTDFLNDHEYWRILTGAVLHGNLLHVLMNSYALYSFGRLTELLTNRAHIAIVFLLSAIGGGLLSLVFVPYGISVGASGGIVGLIGYLAIYTFRRKRFISKEFRRSLLFNIAFILLFGLVLYRVVDNYGHIGGLLTGVVYGVFQIPSDEYRDPRNAHFLTKVFGVIALGVYALAALFSISLLMYFF